MNNRNANITKKLSRWLRGDANIHDERELDRHAQEDPFLAEALEGYRKNIEGNHSERTARLQQKIRQKSKAGSTRSYWRIAAAILVLVVTGTVLYQLNEPKSENLAIAEKNTSPTLAPVQTEAADNSQAAPEEDLAQVQNPAPRQEANTSPPAKRAEKQRQEETTAITPSPATIPPSPGANIAITDEELADDLIEPEADRLAENVAGFQVAKEQKAEADKPAAPIDGIHLKEAPPIASNEGSARRKRKDLPTDNRDIPTTRSNASGVSNTPVAEKGKRIIYGKILDVMGEPIIGATVSLTDLKLSANTDVRGEFELIADSSAHVLQIDYVGYNSLQIDVPEGGNVSERFTLDDESLSLDQIQLALDGLSSTRTKRLEPLAYPQGGRSGFKQHVRENAARGLPKGRVRLRFKIGSDGRPYNIRVERSNNNVLNSSAMYLLQTGPDWVIVQGIAPIDMQFTVRFR